MCVNFVMRNDVYDVVACGSRVTTDLKSILSIACSVIYAICNIIEISDFMWRSKCRVHSHTHAQLYYYYYAVWYCYYTLWNNCACCIDEGNNNKV